jgi:hypothetical protein
VAEDCYIGASYKLIDSCGPRSGLRRRDVDLWSLVGPEMRTKTGERGGGSVGSIDNVGVSAHDVGNVDARLSISPFMADHLSSHLLVLVSIKVRKWPKLNMRLKLRTCGVVGAVVRQLGGGVRRASLALGHPLITWILAPLR